MTFIVVGLVWIAFLEQMDREALVDSPACPSIVSHAACSGHGSCVQSPKRATAWCKCDRGYSGWACEVNEFALSCPYNCSWPSGGQCVKNRGGMAHCVCSAGRSGDGCVDNTPVNCSKPECSGHGECVGGECVCVRGFYGGSCEQGCPGFVESTSQPCNGHGLCAATGSPGHSPDRCRCFIGFEGDACETDVEGVTTCPNGCSGHGTCLHGRCTCNSTFASDDCSIEIRHGTRLALETKLSKLLAVLACFAVSAACASVAWRWVNNAAESKYEDTDQIHMAELSGIGLAGTRKF